MPDELVFTVDGAGAIAAAPVNLSEAGLREREHLQEWVVKNPQIVGSDALVITTEFDRWESRSGSERDRLDVLALDSSGHLVVTELKRDQAPDTVALQSIKYAAMASRFDKELLADAYAEFLRKTGQESLTQAEALEKLEAHTDYQIDAETLRTPRTVHSPTSERSCNQLRGVRQVGEVQGRCLTYGSPGHRAEQSARHSTKIITL